MLRFTLLPLAAALAAAPAFAADPPKAPAQRSAVVFGNDPCPKPDSPDEIIVCSRQPENERYRLPKRFRGKPQEAEAVTGSWANTARSLDQASAPMMPNSCSVVGSGGQTGCMQQFLAQARAQRAADKAAKAAADAEQAPEGD
ncbi:hypothetical protein PQ455_12140 [Sphingomonas naphthae]|uniref:Uncharacterized protein n=1 Tax=Sphingomonas naphthae TaxID=1813468 RepID=A0ABY7THW7_9SPHN|nr:hypothetical protein [Sphingomonas naphthae]WCT72386.1 hypothetical protein PQ455_12140 [Sphingomonas naphthae]